VIQDISVATENMFLQAAALGLGTVWKNLRSEHIEPVKKALGLAENHVVINIIPVGYPKTKPAPHTDKEFDTNKIHKIE
jgi:nitroreductase